MNKKGFTLSMSTAAMIILVIIVFILLLPFVWKLLVGAKGLAEYGVCGQTAALSSLRAEKLCYDYAKSPIPMRCPRREIVFEDDHALLYEGGKESAYSIYDPQTQTTYNTYETLDKDAVKSVIADEMIGCWSKLGSGEIVLLNQAAINRNIFKDKRDKTACFVCSEILFDTELGWTAGGINLKQYLKDTNPKNSRIPYMSYLTSQNVICEKQFKAQTGSSCWEELEFYYTQEFKDVKARFGSGTFDDDVVKNRLGSVKRAYPISQLKVDDGVAIVYMRKRFDSCQKVEQDEEDYELSNFIYAVPLKDVDSLCDAVVI